jgi:hypothetical protein
VQLGTKARLNSHHAEFEPSLGRAGYRETPAMVRRADDNDMGAALIHLKKGAGFDTLHFFG